MKNKIHLIAITGGPGAGKTTGMSYTKQKLEERGYIVLVVPEAASLCINGGLSPIQDNIGVVIAQTAIIETVCSLEKIWTNAAKKLSESKDVVILCDRGVVDSSSYMDFSVYEEILFKLGLDPIKVRDTRYDAVIHMVTAANGAEEYYTLENNEARYETPEQARIQDELLLNSWVGSPHLRAIDNSTDFSGKIHRVFEEICHVLGIPVPIEKEKKYLINFNPNKIPEHAQKISIEQSYLKSPNPNESIRVRKRGQNGRFSYYHTIKKDTGVSGERIEKEKIITEPEFKMALSFSDPNSKPVHKTRICFMYQSQYFELDVFEDQNALMGKADALLEIELTDMEKVVEIPDWITVIKEVTDDSDYSNYSISKRITTT